MATLKAQHLAKSYKGRQVVRDVSMSIDSGQIVGLLGPNGAGKTTCFYMIVGLVQADQGVVRIDEQNVTHLPMHGRALASAPKFILLDEPFAGVDPISVGDIKQIIHHLKAKGIGILITDHNVRETLDICETAYIVNDGQLIAEGDAESILANDLVKEVYLGHEFRL